MGCALTCNQDDDDISYDSNLEAERQWMIEYSEWYNRRRTANKHVQFSSFVETLSARGSTKITDSDLRSIGFSSIDEHARQATREDAATFESLITYLRDWTPPEENLNPSPEPIVIKSLYSIPVKDEPEKQEETEDDTEKVQGTEEKPDKGPEDIGENLSSAGSKRSPAGTLKEETGSVKSGSVKSVVDKEETDSRGSGKGSTKTEAREENGSRKSGSAKSTLSRNSSATVISKLKDSKVAPATEDVSVSPAQSIQSKKDDTVSMQSGESGEIKVKDEDVLSNKSVHSRTSRSTTKVAEEEQVSVHSSESRRSALSLKGNEDDIASAKSAESKVSKTLAKETEQGRDSAMSVLSKSSTISKSASEAKSLMGEQASVKGSRDKWPAEPSEGDQMRQIGGTPKSVVQDIESVRKKSLGGVSKDSKMDQRSDHSQDKKSPPTSQTQDLAVQVDRSLSTTPTSSVASSYLPERDRNLLYLVRGLLVWMTANCDMDLEDYDEDEEEDDEETPMFLIKLFQHEYINHAEMFASLCLHADIFCEVIAGKSKGDNYEPGDITTPDDYWNAVFLAGGWRFVHPEWFGRRVQYFRRRRPRIATEVTVAVPAETSSQTGKEESFVDVDKPHDGDRIDGNKGGGDGDDKKNDEEEMNKDVGREDERSSLKDGEKDFQESGSKDEEAGSIKSESKDSEGGSVKDSDNKETTEHENLGETEEAEETENPPGAETNSTGSFKTGSLDEDEDDEVNPTVPSREGTDQRKSVSRVSVLSRGSKRVEVDQERVQENVFDVKSDTLGFEEKSIQDSKPKSAMSIRSILKRDPEQASIASQMEPRVTTSSNGVLTKDATALPTVQTQKVQTDISSLHSSRIGSSTSSKKSFKGSLKGGLIKGSSMKGGSVKGGSVKGGSASSKKKLEETEYPSEPPEPRSTIGKEVPIGKTLAKLGMNVSGMNATRDSYTDFWFMTQPDFFIHRCYPDQKKWQLLSSDREIKTFQEFIQLPHLYPAYFELGLFLTSHQSCVLSSWHGTCVIQFEQIAFSPRRLHLLHEITIVTIDDMDPALETDLNRLVFYSRTRDSFTFEVRFPSAGIYKFVVVGYEHGSKKKQICCEFTLKCSKRLRNCQKLPIDAGPLGWGYGPCMEDVGLFKPSHIEPKVMIKPLRSGTNVTDIPFGSTSSLIGKQVTLTFSIEPDKVNITLYRALLLHEDCTPKQTAALQDHVKTEVDEDKLQLIVEVTVPVNGEYALVIQAARKPRKPTGKEVYFSVCNYLLTTLEENAKDLAVQRKKARRVVFELVSETEENMHRLANFNFEQDIEKRDELETQMKEFVRFIDNPYMRATMNEMIIKMQRAVE